MPGLMHGQCFLVDTLQDSPRFGEIPWTFHLQLKWQDTLLGRIFVCEQVNKTFQARRSLWQFTNRFAIRCRLLKRNAWETFTGGLSLEISHWRSFTRSLSKTSCFLHKKDLDVLNSKRRFEFLKFGVESRKRQLGVQIWKFQVGTRKQTWNLGKTFTMVPDSVNQFASQREFCLLIAARKKWRKLF